MLESGKKKNPQNSPLLLVELLSYRLWLYHHSSLDLGITQSYDSSSLSIRCKAMSGWRQRLHVRGGGDVLLKAIAWISPETTKVCFQARSRAGLQSDGRCHSLLRLWICTPPSWSQLPPLFTSSCNLTSVTETWFAPKEKGGQLHPMAQTMLFALDSIFYSKPFQPLFSKGNEWITPSSPSLCLFFSLPFNKMLF